MLFTSFLHKQMIENQRKIHRLQKRAAMLFPLVMERKRNDSGLLR